MPGPVTQVKAGAVRIPIYWHAKRGAFRAQWVDDGKRREAQSVDLDKLRAKVRKHAQAMTSGEVSIDTLSTEQKAAVRAVLDRGLTVADLESLRGLRHITLRQAADQFLESKTDRSLNYHLTLRTHLNQIAAVHGARPLSAITATELDAFLARFTNPRTKRNKRGSLIALWRWARSKDYLPQERLTAAERTDAPGTHQEKRTRKIETWSPAEFKTILETVPPEYLPWVVLSAFAGLRTFELFPDEKFVESRRKEVLSYSDIDMQDRKRIMVKAAVSKTAEKRSVPISNPLALWLKSFPNSPQKPAQIRGVFCPGPPPWKKRKSWGGRSCIDRLTEALGVPWKKNALRHSFGTYRVLTHHSLSDVALEMGNSERMIRTHYLDAGRTQEEAEEWFSLGPDQVDRSLRALG